MKEKVVEVKVYTGDSYEGVLIQSDQDKMVIREAITGCKVRIYNNAIISVRTVGWQEAMEGVC